MNGPNKHDKNAGSRNDSEDRPTTKDSVRSSTWQSRNSTPTGSSACRPRSQDNHVKLVREFVQVYILKHAVMNAMRRARRVQMFVSMRGRSADPMMFLEQLTADFINEYKKSVRIPPLHTIEKWLQFLQGELMVLNEMEKDVQLRDKLTQNPLTWYYHKSETSTPRQPMPGSRGSQRFDYQRRASIESTLSSSNSEVKKTESAKFRSQKLVIRAPPRKLFAPSHHQRLPTGRHMMPGHTNPDDSVAKGSVFEPLPPVGVSTHKSIPQKDMKESSSENSNLKVVQQKANQWKAHRTPSLYYKKQENNGKRQTENISVKPNNVAFPLLVN